MRGLRLGVVVWVEGGSVKFRVEEGVRIERGQLVKVVDKGRSYIMRVYGFKPESLLTPAEVAVLSSRKRSGETVLLYDRELRLYDTALATVIAQIESDGEVHGPTSAPSLFTDVLPLGRRELDLLHLDTGDIPIGWLRVGHVSTDIRVAVSGARSIPHHFLIVGVTGSGKSNLGKVLGAGFLRSGGRYSLVIFDCESEYFVGSEPGKYGLAHLRESEDRLFLVTPRVEQPSVVEYRFRYGGKLVSRRIRAYPLKMCYNELHPQDFVLTGDFTSPQEELLWMAFKKFRSEWLSVLVRHPTRVIYTRLERYVRTNTIDVTKRKLKHMLFGDIFTEGPCEYGLPGAVLEAVSRGMVVLFDLPFASEGEEKLLSSTIARRIFLHYEKMRKSSPGEWERLPPVLITVEEAHRYLSKRVAETSGENIFSIIAKRGRKYRVGGMYITQMPGELVETVIRQALTKIILPLPTKPDYTKVAQYTPYLDEAEEEIKSLDRGEALLVSQPTGLRFAVPIRVFSYEELVEEQLRKEVAGKEAG